MDFLIGHLIGDYLLQNDWMARNKKKLTVEGAIACWIHCILWTISVMFFTGWWKITMIDHGPRFQVGGLYLWIAVFFSHWIFDRTGICMWWMKITKKSGQENPFFPLVYVAVDNTCHLVCLWLIQKYLIGA